MNNNSKEFDLSIILSMTSGRLFCTMDELYDLASFLLGYKADTLDLMRNCYLMEDHILSSYPELENIVIPEEFDSSEEIKSFINKQKEIYGNSLPLKPISETLVEVRR